MIRRLLLLTPSMRVWLLILSILGLATTASADDMTSSKYYTMSVHNDHMSFEVLLTDLWATGDTRKVAEGVLAAENIWHEDLNNIPGLTDLVVADLDKIQQMGMMEAVKTIL